MGAMMQGPFPRGHFRFDTPPTVFDWDYRALQRGCRYAVRKSFIDADGHVHHQGDEWTFVGSSFFARDNRLTLIVARADGEYAIPIDVGGVGQPDMLNAWAEHVGKIE